MIICIMRRVGLSALPATASFLAILLGSQILMGCRDVGNPRPQKPNPVSEADYPNPMPWAPLQKSVLIANETQPIEGSKTLRRLTFCLPINSAHALELATGALVPADGWTRKDNVFVKRIPEPEILTYTLKVVAGKIDSVGRVQTEESNHWVGVVFEEVLTSRFKGHKKFVAP